MQKSLSRELIVFSAHYVKTTYEKLNFNLNFAPNIMQITKWTIHINVRQNHNIFGKKHKKILHDLGLTEEFLDLHKIKKKVVDRISSKLKFSTL